MTTLFSIFKKYHATGTAAAVFLLLFAMAGMARADKLDLQPDPGLSPEDVVNFQLTALQNADRGGIAATFRFASPANRKTTGPLSRFSRLFDTDQYQVLLNNRGSDIEFISNDGSTADLLAGVVDQFGNLHWYRFSLSRQSDKPFENCWMTDSVIAIEHPGNSA